MNSMTPVPPQDNAFQLMKPVEHPAASSSPKLRPQKFLLSLRKFWWVPLLTLMLSLGAVAVNFYLSPPEYVSVGSMWETEKLQLPGGAAYTEDPQTYFGNLNQVLTSPTLRQRALERLAMGGTNGLPPGKDPNSIDMQVNVYQAPRSSVFTVQAISSSEAFTPIYLNALMNAYLDYKKQIRKQVSGDTLASISAQVLRLEQEMKNDESVLARFEETNDLVIIEQENQIAGSFLAKLRTQLADYQLQNKLLDALALEKDRALTDSTNAANVMYETVIGGASSSSSATAATRDAYQQVESLKFQRDRLSKYLRPKHPKIIKLDEQIEDAENVIATFRKQNQQDIATEREALKIKMDGVQQSINEWEKKVTYDNARLAEAASLKANITRNRSLYDRLVALLQNVDITRNIDQETLAILQPADSASRSFARLKSNLSMGSFGGLAIGFGIVLLIAIRDDRFTSVIEVAEKIGDDVVGQVPESPQLQNRSPLALMQNTHDHHMYVESYRNIRSALLFLAVDGARPKLLLITSAVPNEGKSTIATNLACTMALGGSKVLLVDGDLRRGQLHDALGLKPKPGLTELLNHPDDLEQYIQKSPLDNLSFLARGSIPRSPGDLFLSPEFDTLLSRLRERFDHVIIDSSPVFAADDSTTLAPKMDGTLFIVRNHFSKANMVKEALNLLHRRQAKVLGLVLNRTNATSRSYHYYNYSEYYPGKGASDAEIIIEKK